MPIVLNGNGSIALSGTPSITPATAVQPAGSILQVLQNVKDDTNTTQSTTFVDTGLSQVITPTTTTSKILITGQLVVSSNSDTIFVNLVRDGTPIGQPDNTSANKYPATNRTYIKTDHINTIPFNFLDSPSITNPISSITYKVQWKTGGSWAYLNLWKGGDYHYSISTLTLMEIAA